MKATGHLLSLLAIATATEALGQFNMSDVQYWIGTGADSSVLVVDFQDGTDDPSYAWGWLHDGGTGEDMVNAISAADPDLWMEVTSGFLNSVTYGSHAGIGGSPDYWSTWDGPDLAGMTSNSGLATEVGNGQWFGCSYTDFNPALAPTEPIAAGVPTGIHEREIARVQVYPQPALNFLNISTSARGGQPVIIFNTSGERVFLAHANGLLTTIDVSALAPGLYVLQVGDVKRSIVVQ